MIKITTDSTCDLPRELLERYNITVTPLGIIKAGKLYQDGVDIRTGDIAAHVDAGGEITTTNAVNVADYEELFRRLMEEYDAVIHLNIGMGFSSCHQNARLAAEEVDGVYVVDSANLTVGHGMLVLAAAEAAEAGKSVTEILAMLEEMIPRVETSFVLDRLDYMKKGGRCSTATALGASLLKLHPCLDVVDGKLPVTKKYRGSIEKVVEEYVRDRLRDRADLDTHRAFLVGHLPGRPPGLHRPGGPASGRAVPGDHRGQGGVHHLLSLRPRHPGRDLPAEGVRPCALRAAGRPGGPLPAPWHQTEEPAPLGTGSLCWKSDLLDGDGLDLAEHALGQLSHGHAAAGGLGGEILGVHLVEGGEVAHVRQETGGLHHAL